MAHELLPLEDWIVTKADILEIEQMLSRIVQPKEVKGLGKVIIGFHEFRAWRGLGAALTANLLLVLATVLLQQALDTTTRRNRRRRRTQLCVLEALAVIESVELAIGDGYAENRSLNYNNFEKRTNRKFDSRA